MKPTQEQVLAWAREARFYEGEIFDDLEWFTVLAALAYEAGRKDENEACSEMVKNWKPEFFKHMTQDYAVHFIRARREQ